MEDRKRRISYFYDSDWGQMYYGANHPMKPHRIVMAHHLVLGYGLHKAGLDVFTPRRAEKAEIAQFHSADYVDFLSKVTPESANRQSAQAALARFNLNEDCPPFSGLWDFCRSYTAASVQGAVRLNHGLCDVAINWAGGLHHAKKAEASGFCYVNDLVLAILELLKYNARVLYIDIDIHHGDGVEEAFYLTDRVMTVSFHRYGDFFFPGTGALGDVGERRGRGYSVNVPLREGVDDATFHRLFKPIMSKVMSVFQPGAVVLQCGADSLGGDRLGCFNLSLDGHAEAVRFVRGFGVPTLVTGGGGYTKTNVARCWANETAALLGVGPLDDALPPNDYLEYYAPRFDLGARQVRAGLDNANARADVDRIGREVLASLSRLEAAPAVAMQELPPDSMLPEYDGSTCGGTGDGKGNPNVSGFFGAGAGAGGGDGGDERLGGYGLRHLVVKEGPEDELGFY